MKHVAHIPWGDRPTTPTKMLSAASASAEVDEIDDDKRNNDYGEPKAEDITSGFGPITH